MRRDQVSASRVEVFGTDALRDHAVRLGLRYLAENNVAYPEFKAAIQDEFVGAIETQYRDELDLVLPNDLKKADLARHFGIHRSNIGRLLSGETSPSLTSFCIVAAANDAIFPRGSHIALNAYCVAFSRVCRELRQAELAYLTPEQALCLYHTVRDRNWHQAVGTRNTSSLKRAARGLTQCMREVVDDLSITTAEAIQDLQRERGLQWHVLEAVLRHEWF